MASWAKRGDMGLDVLGRVQDGLTVDMIMTRRSDFMTCRCEEAAREVKVRNEEHRFSFLPVQDRNGQIQGLYHAHRWFDQEAPDRPIGDDFDRLSEDLVIGANANILEFVRIADERPTRLVISGDRIAGLISQSDLQLLPVRAALSTLMTSLEMTMAERIEAEWPNTASDWLNLLSPGRRTKIRERINIAKEEDGFVNEIVFADLPDKVDIIVKQRLVTGSATKLRRRFKAVGRLRNKLAHANYYAETPEAASEVSAVVRTIFSLKEELHGYSEEVSVGNTGSARR